MKNNQFRAYITKFIYEKVKDYLPDQIFEGFCLSVDIDSNKRIIYVYEPVVGNCIGSISLYFTNEYINISYSKTRSKVCCLTNQEDEKQFSYCDLKQALVFIRQIIHCFITKYRKGE